MQAEEIGPEALSNLPKAEVVLLGEVHDNPRHHLNQAIALKAVRPAAVVFEMLTPEQASIANDPTVAPADLADAMDWDKGGWPPFELYEPVFDALGDARIYGMAVPRENLREVFDEGAAQVFGAEAERFGLVAPLPETEQAAREALQRAAHCDALPEDLLPGMVAAQRLRDASFARTVLQALEDTGGPVAVITGTGHARRDWGMPTVLARAAPDIRVLSVGQIEDTDTKPDDPPFDLWVRTPAAERDDPCAAFAR